MTEPAHTIHMGDICAWTYRDAVQLGLVRRVDAGTAWLTILDRPDRLGNVGRPVLELTVVASLTELETYARSLTAGHTEHAA